MPYNASFVHPYPVFTLETLKTKIVNCWFEIFLHFLFMNMFWLRSRIVFIVDDSTLLQNHAYMNKNKEGTENQQATFIFQHSKSYESRHYVRASTRKLWCLL